MQPRVARIFTPVLKALVIVLSIITILRLSRIGFSGDTLNDLLNLGFMFATVVAVMFLLLRLLSDE